LFQALSSRFFYGWVIVAVALLMNTASSPMNAAVFSFFVTPMRDDLGWSFAALSWGFTLRLAVAGVSGPVLGVMLDRFGPRILGAIAGLIAGVSVLALALVESVWAFYALFALSGLTGFGAPMGQLMTTVPVAKWFQLNRGRAMAIAGIGLPLGTAAILPVVALIIDEFGWRTAWAMLGGFVILMTVPLCLIFMRKDPESVGMHPDGNPRALEEFAAAQVKAGKASVATTEDWTGRQALRSRAFWLVLISTASMSLVLPGTVVYRVSYWEDVGLSTGEIALATSLDPLTVSVTALLVGFVAEKVHARYIGLVGGLIVASSMLWMIFARDNIWFMVAYSVTWGIGMGFNITVSNIIWPNYFGRRHLGTIRGLIFPVAIGASAASAPLFAVMLDATENAAWVWWVTVAGFMLSTLLLLVSRQPRLSDIGVQPRPIP
jgi:sugar phosphate permease